MVEERKETAITAEERQAELEALGTGVNYSKGAFAKQNHANETLEAEGRIKHSIFDRVARFFTSAPAVKVAAKPSVKYIDQSPPLAPSLAQLKTDPVLTRGERARRDMMAHQNHVKEASQPTDSAT